MNLQQALQYGRALLAESQYAALDTELLLCHVINAKPAILHARPEQQLNPQQQLQFEALIAARKKGHPVAHLTGSRGFWTLDLAVTPDTLIPRPDTELLVEQTLKFVSAGMKLADLGTGSGAVALALASENANVQVIATDISSRALTVAKSNAMRIKLDNVGFVQARWLAPFSAHSFDVIISNPPYIEQDDPHLGQGDVRFEPMMALASGVDGLNDIRLIIDQARYCLKPGGRLLLEHGHDQANAVMCLLHETGYRQIVSHKDFGGNDRVVSAQVAL